MNIPGDNLKTFRESCGYTQQEAADFLGIAREQVSYYETGQRVPSAKVLLKLCDLYGVELSDCYAESPQASPENIVLAFRKDSFAPEDLESIASFKKIIKNYLKMERLAALHGL